MLGLIIAVRNFIIALVLSWVGISFTVPKDVTPEAPNTPEKTLPKKPNSTLKIR